MAAATDDAQGPAAIKAMTARAFRNLQPHEQQQGSPVWALNRLLEHAPLDAQVWDLLGHTLKASRAAGIPPAIGGVPGKQLLSALYEIFCEDRGPLGPESEISAAGDEAAQAEARKERFEQWKDMSDLLCSAIKMLFSRAEATLGTE